VGGSGLEAAPRSPAQRAAGVSHETGLGTRHPSAFHRLVQRMLWSHRDATAPRTVRMMTQVRPAFNLGVWKQPSLQTAHVTI
jgi:hypothetical protein